MLKPWFCLLKTEEFGLNLDPGETLPQNQRKLEVSMVGERWWDGEQVENNKDLGVYIKYILYILVYNICNYIYNYTVYIIYIYIHM